MNSFPPSARISKTRASAPRTAGVFCVIDGLSRDNHVLFLHQGELRLGPRQLAPPVARVYSSSGEEEKGVRRQLAAANDPRRGRFCGRSSMFADEWARPIHAHCSAGEKRPSLLLRKETPLALFPFLPCSLTGPENPRARSENGIVSCAHAQL